MDEADGKVFIELMASAFEGSSDKPFEAESSNDLEDPAISNCTWNGLASYNICDSFKGISMLLVQLAFWTLRKDYLKNDPRVAKFIPSFDCLCNFLIAIQLRLLVPLAIEMGLGNYFNQIFETKISFCEFFAFLETFLSTYEVEWLTHLCIERYVVAKYVTNGWPIDKKHYQYYMNLCVIFSLLYASPPLYGFGKYGHEFTCDSCTIDYILPESWQRYVVMAFFFLRSVKPAFFMLSMLFWARQLESRMKTSMKKQTELFFTKMVMVITVMNLLSWAPLAAVKARLLLGQFWFNVLEMPDPDQLRRALCIQEMSPFLTAATILYFHVTRDKGGRR